MKSRKAAFAGMSLAFVGILLVITVVLNLIIGELPLGLARIDFTENKEYTLSEATKNILSRVKDIVTITYHVSKKLPSTIETLRRDTVDFLKELQVLVPRGRLRLRVIDPEQEAQRLAHEREEAKKRAKEAAEQAGKKYEEEEEVVDFDPLTGGLTKRKKTELEKVLGEFAQRGIRPLQAQEIRGGEIKYSKFYSAIEISYRGQRSEVIPDYQSLENLEYEIASRILKLTIPEEEKPLVAFFDGQPKTPPARPNQPFPQPQQQKDEFRILKDQVLRQLFEVKETKLTEESPIPEKTKTLIVAQPKDLNDRQVYEINRFVSSGGNAVFLVGRYNVDLKQYRRVMPVSTGLEKLLAAWGLRIDSRPLNMWTPNECGRIVIRQPTQTPLGNMLIERAVPIVSHIVARPREFKRDSVFLRGLNFVVFPWAAALRVDPPAALAKKKLECEILVRSPQKSWFGDPNAMNLRQLWANGPNLQNPAASEFEDWVGPQTLAVQLRGTFPFMYEGKEVPPWPKKESEEEENEKKKEEEKPQKAELKEPKEAVVVVIGSGDFCKDEYIRYDRRHLGSYILLRNVTEALSLSDELIKIRAKQSSLRPLDPHVSAGTKNLLQWLNVLGVPLLVGLVGLAYAFVRRQASAAYERRMSENTHAGGTN